MPLTDILELQDDRLLQKHSYTDVCEIKAAGVNFGKTVKLESHTYGEEFYNFQSDSSAAGKQDEPAPLSIFETF